ncbi:MAG TPA: DUF1036 domain-containing protein [Rhizomicrobium sp.]|nr:DUF1036 domain-containing protein [Rhizomicrobium sp.]
MLKIARPALALLLLALPAQAGLSVCNKAKHPARVALGRFDGRDWGSEGWWQLAPGQCTDVVKGRLEARYYYLYGADNDAGVWDGATSFCTATKEKFSIPGRGNCAARGYDRRRFFRIDTNDNLNQVQNLQ